MLHYIGDIVVGLRQHCLVGGGPGPSSADVLTAASKYRAILHDSTFVRPVDVDAVVVDCIAHRLVMRAPAPAPVPTLSSLVSFGLIPPNVAASIAMEGRGPRWPITSGLEIGLGTRTSLAWDSTNVMGRFSEDILGGGLPLAGAGVNGISSVATALAATDVLYQHHVQLAQQRGGRSHRQAQQQHQLQQQQQQRQQQYQQGSGYFDGSTASGGGVGGGGVGNLELAGVAEIDDLGDYDNHEAYESGEGALPPSNLLTASDLSSSRAHLQGIYVSPTTSAPSVGVGDALGGGIYGFGNTDLAVDIGVLPHKALLASEGGFGVDGLGGVEYGIAPALAASSSSSASGTSASSGGGVGAAGGRVSSSRSGGANAFETLSYGTSIIRTPGGAKTMLHDNRQSAALGLGISDPWTNSRNQSTYVLDLLASSSSERPEAFITSPWLYMNTVRMQALVARTARRVVIQYVTRVLAQPR